MTKIQELGAKILAIAGRAHWTNKQEWSMINNMIEELTGIAEAPLVVGTIKDIPPDSGANEGYSDDYLIDLDGYRKHFAIGYYDHENNRWILDDDNARADFEPDHMTWQRLPLAKYDEKK